MKKSMLALATVIFIGGVWVGRAEIVSRERGARITTDRFQVDLRDGVVVSMLNKLTGEEYLDPHANLDNIVPHLPGGLGSQATAPELEAAGKLYRWPWMEHPADATWANHHSPSATSKCAFEAKDAAHAIVTYTGLTDGSRQYPDETLAIDLAIDGETGDLLFTPVARSPRKGVYSSSLSVSALGPAITAEAPIFDGLRLDRAMQPMLWVNQWGGYWDYAFLAFNGYKKGALAIWCQDAELKYYKYLHYLINPEGLSFSFTAMNIPPFDDLKEAGAVTWRLQAFEKGWSQAVARFRAWRVKNVKIAPRPQWGQHIAFVNGGVNANAQWVGMIESYFGSSNLERTITFGATIREAGFDANHANNTPYAAFKDDLKLWKQKGPKFMAYLQPMIMWDPKPKTAREKQGVAAHAKADTISVFQKPGAGPLPNIDQHHLGQPDWQRWFLDWVKEYIQVYGADAVYHDQSYHCPVDSRGLAVGGKTSTQGMADYFFKAQTENPNALHGTEHMTEVNNVGASLGIGSGILWGTAECMRKQRIDHPSPVCNALHYPNGAIFSFPHFSQIICGILERIHWGMNLSEGRGELAYAALQNPEAIATKGLANERWLDVVRSRTFVHKGLHAVFPEDWDPSVLSYFKGAKGDDFRYIKMAWGSAFVEISGNKTNLCYGRIHGTPYAEVVGGIYGWPCYNAKGPAGLHPNRYYVLDPGLQRPAVYFSSNNQFARSLYEGYLDDGFIADSFAYITLKPREDLLGIIGYDSVILNTAAEPRTVLLNGVSVKPLAQGNGKWKIDYRLQSDPITIVAILKELPAGVAQIAAGTVARTVASDWNIDQYLAGVGLDLAKAPPIFSEYRSVILAPVRAPLDQGDGALKVSLPEGVTRVAFNGVDKPLAASLLLPMKAGEQGLLLVRSTGRPLVKYEWVTIASEGAGVGAPAAKK